MESVIDKESIFVVTGGAGFIGSNLCEELLKRGYRIRCLDNLSTGRMENIEKLLKNSRFDFMEGDIRDTDICDAVCKNADYVLHHAAWGSVPRSIELPLLYEEINIRGALNMMEAARKNHIKKFVYASSSSVYGDEPRLPKVEECVGNLLSPYAITKRANEEYGKIYHKLYGLETIGLRYFNVFGKNQNPEGDYAAVIPKFIKLLLHNQAPIIYGDGKQSRDFTYVKNVVEANIKACEAQKEASGQIFNIACGEQLYLIDVYYAICKLLNKKIEPCNVSERKGDIKHSNANISKAQKILHYEPQYKFEEGLSMAIDWYKKEMERL